MPLTLLQIGEKAKIVALTGKPSFRKHLAELGFILGRSIEVVQHSFGNNLIVAMEGARMAIDRRMAHNIHISLQH